jgi:hypothetical protein
MGGDVVPCASGGQLPDHATATAYAPYNLVDHADASRSAMGALTNQRQGRRLVRPTAGDRFEALAPSLQTRPTARSYHDDPLLLTQATQFLGNQWAQLAYYSADFWKLREVGGAAYELPDGRGGQVRREPRCDALLRLVSSPSSGGGTAARSVSDRRPPRR